MRIVHRAGLATNGLFRRCDRCGTVLPLIGLEPGTFVETGTAPDDGVFAALGDHPSPNDGSWVLCRPPRT